MANSAFSRTQGEEVKYIEGRTFTSIPEWVRIILFTLSAMLLAIILFHASEPKASTLTVEQEPPKHTFYIINREEYTNMENRTVYVLEYACDGMAQITPSFPTLAERDKFELYLTTLGNVEQYKGKK
jgi:hypothetical protein